MYTTQYIKTGALYEFQLFEYGALTLWAATCDLFYKQMCYRNLWGGTINTGTKYSCVHLNSHVEWRQQYVNIKAKDTIHAVSVICTFYC